jgi:G:T-mismatch repair DNA endonuclease (very short patch repair protein)
MNEGWRVAVVWECSTRDSVVFNDVILELFKWIEDDRFEYFELAYKKV